MVTEKTDEANSTHSMKYKNGHGQMIVLTNYNGPIIYGYWEMALIIGLVLVYGV